MSQLIVCRECGTENVSGSKFCNNCGAKLPPATHIICPNCQTANSVDRVFCDNCGTRLVSNEIQDDEPSPPPASPPTAKAFSLPSRRPGDTGKLDPGVLPDWLRTGKPEASEESGDAAEESVSEESEASLPQRIETGKLPRVEDLTPEKRMTDDLPDWLVNEGDSNPIIDSPEGISTELFLDLVSKAEEEDEVDAPLDTSGANLPDWLVEANNLSTQRIGDDDDDAAAEAEEDSAVDDFQAPVWLLADVDETDFDDDPSPADPHLADDFSVTDWLSDPDDEAHETSGEEDGRSTGMTDWLTDSEPAMDAAGETALPDVVDEEDAELSDWLMQLNQLAEADEPAADLSPVEWDETELDEAGDAEVWLSDLTSEPFGVEDKEEPFGVEDKEEPVAADDDDDWLASLAAELSSDEGPPADSPPAAAASPPNDDELADEIVRTFSAVGSENVASEFTDLFQLEGGDTGELPDWLADVAAEGESLVADKDDDGTAILDDLFTQEEMAAQSELDWLMQTGGLSLPPEEETARGDTGELDWLSDLASLDTDMLRAQADAEEVEEAPHELSETADTLPEAVSEPAADATSEPWEALDPFPTSEAEAQEALPDWLAELGPPGGTLPPDATADVDSIPDQELPDWLTNLRPDDSIGDIGSSLPSALTGSDSELADGLEDIPAELAGADLPDWLGSEAAFDLTQEMLDQDEASTDAPDWLQQEGKPEKARAGDADEWDALLDELPPPAKANDLAQADIPEWLRDLKPSEQAAGADSSLMPAMQEGPVEEEGPLVGLQGVVKLSPAVTAVQRQIDLTPFTVTAAQQQQSVLLRQLTQSSQASERVTEQVLQPGTSVWVRILLAALLLAALLAGLLLPQAGRLTAADGDVTAVFEAVQAAAGRPVLLAFEYTPAMMGELTPAAETLAAQLAANGSPVLTISQYATGVALAEAVVGGEGRALGYLPGEALGLRALGDCLSRQAPTCMSVSNWETHQALLADAALVVVLSGERDSLQNWIEQVGSQVDAPLLLVAPQSLQPVAAPYLASGQLAGLLAGAPATAVYRTAVFQQATGAAPDSLAGIVAAQTLTQLAAVLILLAGMIVYGLFSVSEKPKQAK